MDAVYVLNLDNLEWVFPYLFSLITLIKIRLFLVEEIVFLLVESDNSFLFSEAQTKMIKIKMDQMNNYKICGLLIFYQKIGH